MAGRLEVDGEQLDKGGEDAGRDLPPQHHHPGPDQPGVREEEVEDGVRRQKEDPREDNCHHRDEQKTEPDEFLHPAPVPRAVEVADQRLAAEGEAGQHQLGDHDHLQDNPHRGDLVVAVGEEVLVCQDHAGAGAEVGDGRRDADAEDLDGVGAGDPAVGGPDREGTALADDNDEEVDDREDVAQHRRDRRPEGAHPQHRDEDRVEDDVDNGAPDRADHRLLAHPLRPQEVGVDKGADHEGRPHRQRRVVGEGMGPGRVVRPEEGKGRALQEEHQDPQRRPDQQRPVETEGAGPPSPFRVLRPQLAGDQRRAALAEDVAEGHQHREDWPAEGDRRDDVGVARLGDEEGVGEVVDHRHDHAGDQRHRQF